MRSRSSTGLEPPAPPLSPYPHNPADSSCCPYPPQAGFGFRAGEGPSTDANRAAGVLAALNAQIREAGGCGDPQCVACSGAATADEPIEGDTTIADLEGCADSGEAVEEQGE